MEHPEDVVQSVRRAQHDISSSFQPRPDYLFRSIE